MPVQPYVVEEGNKRLMQFSILAIQSRMDLADPDALDIEYTRVMMGFLLFTPAPQHIAMVGLGGGSLAKFCHRHLPSAQMTVVEINPHVIALREAFHVPPDSNRFSVLLGDGAAFVREPPRLFDVLLIDGFDYDGHPPELSSQRFYDDCLNALAPGGVLVVNLHFGHPEFPQLVERMRRSAGGVALVVEDDEHSNSVVFAPKPKEGARRPSGLGPVRRPKALAEPAWAPLRASFQRIQRALRQEAS